MSIDPVYLFSTIGSLAVAVLYMYFKYRFYKRELELKKEFQQDGLPVNVLEKAKLMIHMESLFVSRMSHFKYECEFISPRFVPILLSRCKRLIEEEKEVVLIIDSGITLLSVFQNLGQELVKCDTNEEKWIKKLNLVSNNLAGIESFMRYGSTNPSNRYSLPVINCTVLPGNYSWEYSNLMGNQTKDVLEGLKNKHNDNTVFVSLTTGFWIRIRRREPRCPIPIVRGLDHLTVTQKLIDISNEIYVLAPLGKTIVNHGSGSINKVLKLEKRQMEPDKNPYEELTIDSDKAATVKYVSTVRQKTRTRARVLSFLSNAVSMALDVANPPGNLDSFINDPIKKVPHILFPFDDLPDDWHFELEQEVPNDQIRNSPEFLKDFLLINTHP